MKMKASTISLMVCSLILAGCLRQQTIIGKWQQVGGTETIEFLKDGSFIVEDGGRPKGGGKYTVLDDHQLKIELGGMLAVTGPMLTKYVIAGENLTLTGPDGGDTTYRLAK